jgi:hypothetical protein
MAQLPAVSDAESCANVTKIEQTRRISLAVVLAARVLTAILLIEVVVVVWHNFLLFLTLRAALTSRKSPT